MKYLEAFRASAKVYGELGLFLPRSFEISAWNAISGVLRRQFLPKLSDNRTSSLCRSYIHAETGTGFQTHKFLCSWARHVTLTVRLSNQCKNGYGLRWTSIPSRGSKNTLLVHCFPALFTGYDYPLRDTFPFLPMSPLPSPPAGSVSGNSAAAQSLVMTQQESSRIKKLERLNKKPYL